MAHTSICVLLKKKKKNNFYIAEAILRKKFAAFEELLCSNNKYSDYNGVLESAESEAFLFYSKILKQMYSTL